MDGTGEDRRNGAGSTSDEPADRSVADWLNGLFAAPRNPGGSAEPSNAEVARAIRAAGWSAVSAGTIGRLRRGEAVNPTLGQIESLARYFGVSPIGAFGPVARRRLDATRAELRALRNPAVQRLSRRLAMLPACRFAAVAAEVDAALGRADPQGGNGPRPAPPPERGPHTEPEGTVGQP